MAHAYHVSHFDGNTGLQYRQYTGSYIAATGKISGIVRDIGHNATVNTFEPVQFGSDKLIITVRAAAAGCSEVPHTITVEPCDTRFCNA